MEGESKQLGILEIVEVPVQTRGKFVRKSHRYQFLPSLVILVT